MLVRYEYIVFNASLVELDFCGNIHECSLKTTEEDDGRLALVKLTETNLRTSSMMMTGKLM